MVDEVLNRVEIVEKVGVERAYHVGAHGADYAIHDIPVLTHTRAWAIRLRACTVGVVVAPNDVDVRVGALPARVMTDQV